jgi:CheY-like chemotaxis protein
VDDHPSLAGRQLLVLEDDYLSATTLACYLQAHGAQVVGPVSNVADAMKAIDTCGPLDAAILDVSLQDDNSYAVADRLRGSGVPSVFITGYEREDLPAAYDSVPLLSKPFGMQEMLRVVLQELEKR